MSKHRNFDDNQKFYASWTDAIQEFVGSAVIGFRMVASSATAITVAASTGSAQASIGIDGRWRYRSSDFPLTITGGAGVKDIFAVTVLDNDFTGAGNDPDATQYNWELRATTAGGTPSSVAAYRKIGEVDWDGSKITGIRQLIGLGDSTFPIDAKPVRVDGTAVRATGLASQVGDILQVLKSDGTKYFAVEADGDIIMSNGKIIRAYIADDAINNAKIETDAVDSNEIKADAVGRAETGPWLQAQVVGITGNNGSVSLSWPEAMPSAFYTTTVTVVGTAAPAAGACIASQDVNGCTILFDGCGSGTHYIHAHAIHL